MKPEKPWLRLGPPGTRYQEPWARREIHTNRRRYKAIKRRNYWKTINLKRSLEGKPEISLTEISVR